MRFLLVEDFLDGQAGAVELTRVLALEHANHGLTLVVGQADAGEDSLRVFHGLADRLRSDA